MSELFGRKLVTPLGELQVVVTPVALQAILWPDHPEGLVNIRPEALDRNEAQPAEVSSLFDATETQLSEYLNGQRTIFDLPLDPKGTAFQLEVWEALQSIPYGETRSYGALSSAIGRPSAARAVGAAIGKNPLSVVVPCHRVIGASGSLVGFAGGLSAKAKLLELENSDRQLW